MRPRHLVRGNRVKVIRQKGACAETMTFLENLPEEAAQDSATSRGETLWTPPRDRGGTPLEGWGVKVLNEHGRVEIIDADSISSKLTAGLSYDH